MRAAPLVFLVGSTATGKSDLAVEACQRFMAHESLKSVPPEIISADSVLFYRELVIGSARPSIDEMTRVPHHLIGFLSVADDFTAGEYYRRVVDLIQSRPETPFVVAGGSGFYIQVLLKGLYPLEKANPALRLRLEERAAIEGLEALHVELSRRDAELAMKVSKNDRYRVIRALEAMESIGSGETLSEIRNRFEEDAKYHTERAFPGRRVSIMGLRAEKGTLEKRVRERARKMLNLGLIEEVRGLSRYWQRPALHSVGYKETVDYLKSQSSGEAVSLNELSDRISQSTMRLAKKQRTWFSRDDATQRIEWFDCELEKDKARERLSSLVSGD